MAIKTFTAGSVLTASDTNTYLANSGLVYVASTTFTASNLITVDNCFTSTYDSYRIICYDIKGSTTVNTSYLKFRVGGVANSGAAYGTAAQYATLGGVTGALAQNGSTAGWYFCNVETTFFGRTVLDISSPATTNWTTCQMQSFACSGDGWVGSQTHTVSTAYDGFQISVGVGTMTGKLAVYGYRKA